MKLKKGFTKISLIFAIIFGIVFPAVAAESIPPMWIDFCPDGLEKIYSRNIQLLGK